MIAPNIANINTDRHVQQIKSIPYFACAVNIIDLVALSTIASKQATGMENTMLKTKQLLDYLATHPEAKVQFQASDMI
jgi:hypothetical protein